MTKNQNNRLKRTVAASVALAFAGLGLGLGPASAVQVAGQDETFIEQSVATDSLNIRLTKGNPDDDTNVVAGSVEGVKIHLGRLKGINPKDAADMERVRDASLTDVSTWPTDLHLTKITGSNGEVQFDNLDNGIYLVTSTAPEGNYREINAFLVAVPFHSLTSNPAPVPGVIVAKTHTPGKTPPATPPETTPRTPNNPPGDTPGDTPKDTPGDTPRDNSRETPRERPSDEPTPADSTEPVTPVVRDNEPPAGEPPVNESRVPSTLAMTGAQVMGLVALASVLIIAGFIIIAASRITTKESGKN